MRWKNWRLTCCWCRVAVLPLIMLRLLLLALNVASRCWGLRASGFICDGGAHGGRNAAYSDAGPPRLQDVRAGPTILLLLLPYSPHLSDLFANPNYLELAPFPRGTIIPHLEMGSSTRRGNYLQRDCEVQHLKKNNTYL